jgi:hypothetical protein
MKVRIAILLVLGSLMSGCLKPVKSKVRVSNYYIESISNVYIGIDQVIFEKIPKQTQTEYQDLNPGKYSIYAESVGGKIFETEISADKRKEGKFTILIDGIGRISVQDDNK